ncbi:hypothetical protein ASPBRDRAFT_39720 [Aspergillus brasiliensis CBS 101740]|uniref:Secreted protein n=1 Tax=Aspergillus brasiliensis (strain CBS 101740 / IMI 381727 / IBT 21946) TaxID=767769 RepID=A0A1L9US60_ASPBC|nr:hypothetical protein ASPBRDRAFT_39720 [Aspergillus brasiliensis CBS 101740]
MTCSLRKSSRDQLLILLCTWVFPSQSLGSRITRRGGSVQLQLTTTIKTYTPTYIPQLVLTPFPLQARIHQESNVFFFSGGDRPTVVSDCSPVPINPIG